MELAAWITGVGAVLSAVWGVALIVREVRSRQSKEIQRLDGELQRTQEQLISNHRYAYELRATLADHGIETPAPPPVRERDT